MSWFSEYLYAWSKGVPTISGTKQVVHDVACGRSIPRLDNIEQCGVPAGSNLWREIKKISRSGFRPTVLLGVCTSNTTIGLRTIFRREPRQGWSRRDYHARYHTLQLGDSDLWSR